jgi:hypothetical protein
VLLRKDLYRLLLLLPLHLGPLLCHLERVVNCIKPNHAAGLPLNIQKELAQDIGRAGGIKLLSTNKQSLSFLCNSRENVYGKRDHPLRQQVQKLIYCWKVFDQKGIYVDKVLNWLNVKSIANLKQAGKNPPLYKADNDVGLRDSESSSNSSVSSTSSNNSTSSPPMPKRVSTKKRMSCQSQDKQPHSHNTHIVAPSGACKFINELLCCFFFFCTHLSPLP